jgi:hypothetical protein
MNELNKKELFKFYPIEFDNVGIFENGIAEVIYRDLNLYVNKRGELLPKL